MTRDPGRSEPFVTLVPATADNKRTFVDCYTSGLVQIATAALYLRAGKYMPNLAKWRGVFIGFCDSNGMRADESVATHIGFTAGDSEEMEAADNAAKAAP